MRFRATIESSGKTATGIRVPEEVVIGLGAGKRPPVRVTINGHTYRGTVAIMGGVFMMGVSAENRARAGVAASDVVDVDIELDTQPREGPCRQTSRGRSTPMPPPSGPSIRCPSA
jgi:hypothetical protein